jgi:hypothetical protein
MHSRGRARRASLLQDSAQGRQMDWLRVLPHYRLRYYGRLHECLP